MDIKTLITPSLHPANIEAIEGYNDDTRGYVALVMEAFDTAYQGIGKIYEAKAAAGKNQAWNENQQVLIVAEFAEKHQTAIAKKFDAAFANLDKGITAMEAMLNDPVKADAERLNIAQEIRSHVKGLSEDERLKFLTDAQAAGDVETLRAVLGAPAYLSGMGNDERQLRTRMFHEQQNPEVSKRLKVMHAARALMEKRSGLVFNEVEKAIGSSWDKVKSLRTSQGKAEQALKFG